MTALSRSANAAFDLYDVIIRAAVRVAEVLVVAIAFFITAAMILGVFFRFALNASIGWTDEVSSLLLSVMMFLVIGIGMHERIHIGLSALIDRIPLRARRWFDVALHVVALTFFAIIAVQGVRVASLALDMSLATVPLPRGLFQFAAPIGSCFAAAVCINNILKVSRGIEDPHGQTGD